MTHCRPRVEADEKSLNNLTVQRHVEDTAHERKIGRSSETGFRHEGSVALTDDILHSPNTLQDEEDERNVESLLNESRTTVEHQLSVIDERWEERTTSLRQTSLVSEKSVPHSSDVVPTATTPKDSTISESDRQASIDTKQGILSLVTHDSARWISAGALRTLKYIALTALGFFAAFLSLCIGRALADMSWQLICDPALSSASPMVLRSVSFCQNFTNAGPDFTDLIEIQGTVYDVLNNAGADVAIARRLHDAEFAMRDLSSVVKVKAITELGKALDAATTSMRAAGRALRKFGTRAGGLADSVVIIDEYILYSLDKARKISDHASFFATLGARVLGQPTPTELKTTTLQALHGSWHKSVVDTSKAVKHLLSEEAQKNVELFKRVRANMDTVCEEIIQGHLLSNVTTDELDGASLLAGLWAVFGAHDRVREDYENNSLHLGNIRETLDFAYKRVRSAVKELKKIDGDLHELRGTAGAQLEDSAPLEVQIKKIQAVIEQLSRGKSELREKEDYYWNLDTSVEHPAIGSQ